MKKKKKHLEGWQRDSVISDYMRWFEENVAVKRDTPTGHAMIGHVLANNLRLLLEGLQGVGNG